MTDKNHYYQAHSAYHVIMLFGPLVDSLLNRLILFYQEHCMCLTNTVDLHV